MLINQIDRSTIQYGTEYKTKIWILAHTQAVPCSCWSAYLLLTACTQIFHQLMCQWAIGMLVFLISKNSKTKVCFHIFPYCWLSLIVSKAAVRFQTPSACSFSDVRNAFRTKAFKARSLFHCEMICPSWRIFFGWLENLLILGSFWEDSWKTKPPKLRGDLGRYGWFEIGHKLLLPHPVRVTTGWWEKKTSFGHC